VKKGLFLLAIFLISLGCGGYKAKKNRLSPEEIKVADLAQQVESQAAQLKSEKNQDLLTELNERASRFRNACLRFGSNSLEARGAFDKLYYQAAQISSTVTPQNDPELYAQWEKLRTGTLMQIAEILGYRPEKANQ
jgi:hypothetical protein